MLEGNVEGRPGTKDVRFRHMGFLLYCGLGLAASGTLLTEPAFAEDEFIGLGVLEGQRHSEALAISADGSVIVGRSGKYAFRWTARDGMTDIGELGSHSMMKVRNMATAVNSDGSVIVGESGHQAFRWTARDGMVGLGFLSETAPGIEFANHSRATGVSGDGSIIVGTSNGLAFRWTAGEGMTRLDLSPAHDSSMATAISADGRVIVGAADFFIAGHSGFSVTQAFRWSATQGTTRLGTLPHSTTSTATAVNHDGSVIAGYSGDEAFRWTRRTGMVGLGVLPGTTQSISIPAAISADGSVIVGHAFDEYGSRDEMAFRWTERTGMQLVGDWLAENGIDVGDWQLERATGISADGTVIVGSGLNLARKRREAWLARAGGLIGVEEFTSTLAGISAVGTAVMGAMDTLLHGLHGRPVTRRRGAPGWCAWASGDIGRNTHGQDDGGFGLGEFGLCHRDAETYYVGIGIAYSHFSQDLAYDGRMYSDGAILSLEGQLKLAEAAGAPLWLVTTGSAGFSGMEIERGYLNGGAIDSSRGDTTQYSYGLSGRLEWENALRLSANASVSPHVKATVLHARIDGYTETGGGFPAVFSTMKKTVGEIRTGADIDWTPGDTVRFYAGAEYVRRLGDPEFVVSGTVPGLFDFTGLGSGQYERRDWAQMRAGMEYGLGRGLLNLSLNGTTKGPVPAWWVNLSYGLSL